MIIKLETELSFSHDDLEAYLAKKYHSVEENRIKTVAFIKERDSRYSRFEIVTTGHSSRTIYLHDIMRSFQTFYEEAGYPVKDITMTSKGKLIHRSRKINPYEHRNTWWNGCSLLIPFNPESYINQTYSKK